MQNSYLHSSMLWTEQILLEILVHMYAFKDQYNI